MSRNLQKKEYKSRYMLQVKIIDLEGEMKECDSGSNTWELHKGVKKADFVKKTLDMINTMANTLAIMENNNYARHNEN